MTSASFTIDGALPIGPMLVEAGDEPVSLALVDTAGATDVEWSFVGASEADYTFPTITVTGRGTATFVLPPEPEHGFGLTLLLQCRNGSQIARALVCTGTTSQIATGESTERGPQGWSPQMNANFRDAAGPTGPTGATGATGPDWDHPDSAIAFTVLDANLTYSVTAGGGGSVNGAHFLRMDLGISNALRLLNAGATNGKRLTILALASGAYTLTVRDDALTTLDTVNASQSPCLLEYIFLDGLNWSRVRRTENSYS